MATLVTHCICAKQSFAAVLTEARRSGWTSVDEIETATGCGARCRLCRPYLDSALSTGQTQFLPRSPLASDRFLSGEVAAR